MNCSFAFEAPLECVIASSPGQLFVCASVLAFATYVLLWWQPPAEPEVHTELAAVRT